MLTVTIPAGNKTALLDRLAKLNKKAAKLGLEPLEIDVGELRVINPDKDADYTNLEFDVTVLGEAPVVNGWELAASVEFMGGDAVVSKRYDDFECPAHYRTDKPFCEHCNTHKVKRYAVLLRNVETNELKMVGKTCLKDFLTDDIEAEVRRFNWLCELFIVVREEGIEGTGSGTPMYNVTELLELTATLVEKDGYRPTKWDFSTATEVRLITSISKEHPYPEITDTAKVYATNVINYFLNDAEENDFVKNVKTLMKAKFIDWKYIGYIVGAVGGYEYHLKKLAEDTERAKENAAILNEHFGEVKTRYTIDVTLKKVTLTEGFYGTTYVHTFRDADNRAMTWFGSKRLVTKDDNEVEVGDTIAVKATVKSHGEYRDIKQTVITRVSPA